MTTMRDVHDRLRAHEPERLGRADLAQASVAAVLREAAAGPEILFIERARRDGDPWSGHMAFPGGRMEEGDLNSRAVAERETLEEVGVSLAEAEHLGLLAELQGNPRFEKSRLVISAHVYHVHRPDPFVLETSEVHAALWFPLADLHDARRHVEYRSPRAAGLSFPGIVVGSPERQVVWGLTYRFVDLLLQAIDRPLPDRWQPVGEFRLGEGATER